MADQTASSPAEELKKEGNDYFQKNLIAEAIGAYSRAIQACSSQETLLKCTLYSNRAACYLHQRTAASANSSDAAWRSCVDDCTSGLELLDQQLHVDDEKTVLSIRGKLLYRRAKARFLLHCAQNDDGVSSGGNDPLLQDAAKDLLSLLSFDAHNKQAATLLNTVRAKHGIENVLNTPVRKTLQKLMDAGAGVDTRQHDYKVLLGLVTNDPASASMDITRHANAIQFLWNESMCPALALQCLSAACQHGPFIEEMFSIVSQTQLADRISIQAEDEEETYHARMAVLSLWLRLIQYLDCQETDNATSPSKVDGSSVLRTCMTAFQSGDPRLVQASLEISSTWTHPQETNDSDETQKKKTVKTEAELRSMKPREVAAYKKRLYERQEQIKGWSKERALALCQSDKLQIWLTTAIHCESNGLRREMGMVLGRVLNCLDDQDEVKRVIKPVLQSASGATIEEVHNDFDEKLDDQQRLEDSMKQGQLLCSLLLGVPEVGAWALSETEGLVDDLIESDNLAAASIASEIVSAGASVEKARVAISRLPLNILLASEDRGVRSGAASAVAKLGLADKALSANEGEVMGLLQVAVELLDDSDTSETGVKLSKTSNVPGGNSQATTAVERGIEVLTYLAPKTQVKEELAHGFQSGSNTDMTALERLVDLACAPNAGESLSAYGLAAIFALMAVSTQTLRKEAFEGKDITMEQYDELQALGKTQEEKDLEPTEADDPLSAVHDRIKKMANANVPRSLVKLMEGATESTTEQLVVAMNRMAVEPSVRGVMVQQGVLSACLKVENDSQTDTGKKILRVARHCIAKLLVSLNPALLTSSQRLGSIKPLIQLIRDSDASDLQQFEALMAITNLGSLDYETKDHIVSAKGIPSLSYAMYSDHEMVRRAGTEAMVNLVGHPAMTKHLSDPETLRLWLAFASDYEANFECARAAAGCLAMSSDDPVVAKPLIGLNTFAEMTTAMLESGNLEIMHRILVMLLNLMGLGGEYREAVVSAGLVAFCRAYVETYHDGSKQSEMNFSAAERGQLSVTIEIAKQIVSLAD